MEEQTCRIEKFGKILANVNLFGKDPDAFRKAVDGLRDAQETLAALEEQWLELEMKREEIERI